MTAAASHEHRMLVGGALEESDTGRTFDNVDPVLVVIPFEDGTDAVRIANDSVYGLSGGGFSGSLERSLSVAERVRTGTLAVNGGMPIGQYLETKSVAWPTPR